MPILFAVSLSQSISLHLRHSFLPKVGYHMTHSCTMYFPPIFLAELFCYPALRKRESPTLDIHYQFVSYIQIFCVGILVEWRQGRLEESHMKNV